MNPQIDRDLVCEFVFIFSRFEYAMMQAGFYVGTSREVHPDWTAIGRQASSHSPEQLSRALAAGWPVLQARPRKLVRVREGLAWSEAVEGSPAELERVLLNIRRVRGNLFHGGVYSDGPAPEPAADALLLKASIDTLREVLQLPRMREVREHFRHGQAEAEGEG